MYLGLDLGTSGVRALLADDQGVAVAVGEAPLEVSHPAPGWSEQDPGEWIAACETAISTLRSSHGDALTRLRAIGLSGQMHGATLLDADDRVLRPCILWNDTRAAAEAADLDRAPDVRTLSGNIVFPGFTAPKLRWVETHEPDVFAATAKVLLPKDYVRLLAHWRACLGHVGCCGHDVARCWCAHLVRPIAGGGAYARRPDAALGRGQRSFGHAACGPCI
jgi:xylulokinase